MSVIVIFGVDPGLVRCGWGVVAADGARLSHVAHGVIRPPTSGALAGRLAYLFDALTETILAHRPHEAAAEETYVNANARAALALGQARGAALAASARAGLEVAEYSPATIKKAVVGTGRADKGQIAFMVQRLLPSAGAVSADAADALGVAICHSAHRVMRSKTSA